MVDILWWNTGNCWGFQNVEWMENVIMTEHHLSDRQAGRQENYTIKKKQKLFFQISNNEGIIWAFISISLLFNGHSEHKSFESAHSLQLYRLCFLCYLLFHLISWIMHHYEIAFSSIVQMNFPFIYEFFLFTSLTQIHSVPSIKRMNDCVED